MDDKQLEAKSLCKKTYRKYWSLHPEKVEYLLKWYPHWGAELLAKVLDIPVSVIQNKARTLKLKVLKSREERICYYCQLNFVGSHKKFGIRCAKCFKPYRAEKRQAAIHQDPLTARLREVAYQLYARNNRKGIKKRKVSAEDLLQIWKEQGGRCVYSGRKMIVSDVCEGKRGPDTLSVDRIDSQQGYFISNIVLCTWWTNVAKYDLDTTAFIERCREVVQKADACVNQITDKG